MAFRFGGAAAYRPAQLGPPARAHGRDHRPDADPGRSRPAPGRGGRGLLAGALCAGGVALIPWLFVLADKLSSTTFVAHWSATWIGLDALEAAGLVTTGLLLRRPDPRAALSAAVTATLLLLDAWFDVMTAASSTERVTAVGTALALEIPLSTLLTILALRTPRPTDCATHPGRGPSRTGDPSRCHHPDYSPAPREPADEPGWAVPGAVPAAPTVQDLFAAAHIP